MNVSQFKTLPFYIKLACVLFSLIALVFIVITAKIILSPLIFSCLLSILLLPFASFLENKLKLPRSAASMISVIILLACIGLLFYIIASQVSNLTGDWPQFQETDKGGCLGGWSGERWLDVRKDGVWKVMKDRIKLASDKGCDAIDPDNMGQSP